MKLQKNFGTKALFFVLLVAMSISCSTKQYVKTTEAFCEKKLTEKEQNKFPKPKSPHESLEGHDWLQLNLNNGQWVEYQKIGNQGETIIFVCGILDDSIVTFSKMPELINKAKNGYCQLYYLNLPGNGYSSIPDRNYFNPIYLRNCLVEFILEQKITVFSIVGNSNGGLISVLLASHKKYGKEFRIKNILGFNPLLKEISFWEMDKYQKLLVKCPSSVVQYTIQTPFIGRKFVELTLMSVVNKRCVESEHVDLFYNRLSQNYRCGIWSDYLKNALGMMSELKEICNGLYENISKRSNMVIFYSNPGDNWIPCSHVQKIANAMNVEFKILANGHIPQLTHSELVEDEILKILNL